MKHHPTLCSTGRHGCWSYCSCGWESGTYRTVIGAHLAFGQHLVTANHATCHPLAKESA